MTTNQDVPDSSTSPVDVNRVCTSMDAPWDARNDRLTQVLRWSAKNPAQAEVEIRHLLEQGININARDGNRWRVLRLATYFQAPMNIRNMLDFASREGSAPVSTPSGAIAGNVCSIANVPCDRSGCGQCEREVHAIFLCRERSSGHCPFVEREGVEIYIFTRPSWVVIALAPLVLVFGNSTWVGWVALACVISALVLLAITRERLLYNTQSYVWLQRTTVAGLEWSYQWSWELGMPIRLEPTPSLAYPLSISSLSVIHSTSTQPVTLIRTALIELLAKQNIAAYLFRSYAATSERPTPTFIEAYVALVERHAKGFENLGALEKRLFLAVRSRSAQRAVQRVVQPSFKYSMAGLRLYKVVRAVYQHDVPDPKSWLADLVANDAIERGVASITGRWLWEKVEWNSDHLSRLRNEGVIALSLSGKLRTMFPEFSYLIDAEIESAISSRVKESGGGGGGGG